MVEKPISRIEDQLGDKVYLKEKSRRDSFTLQKQINSEKNQLKGNNRINNIPYP